MFYNSLGHKANIIEQPTPLELMRRGFLWAAAGKQVAREQGVTAEHFRSAAKMF